MKKFGLILASILLALPPLIAQVSNPSIIVVSSAPSGSCGGSGLPMQYVFSTGVLYACQNGTWGQIGGGGGGGPYLPLAGGTMTGLLTTPEIEVTGKVAAQQIGAIYQADSYTGADASVKINACIAALATTGGTCDARGLGGTQSMSQEIDLKGASSGRSVTLLLPNNGTWTWSKTDGTSCGIKQFSNTYLLGSQPGGNWGGLALGTANSSTNMDSLYCTDPSTASYIRAEGFTAFNSGAGTLANGVLHVNTTFDESSFRYILGNNATGDVWHIDGPCCGTTFDNIQGYGSSATSSSPAGYPLRINGGRALSITNSTFDGPGNGKSNIYISNSGPQDVVFKNVYMEKYQDDYATPMVYIGTSDSGITFEGGFISTGCTTTGCSQYAFENHSAGGIAIKSVGLDYQTVNGVNDVAFGRTWLSDGGTIQDYQESSALSPYQFIDHATSNSTYAETPTSTQVQDLAGAVQFTPTLIGWYRLLSTWVSMTCQGRFLFPPITTTNLSLLRRDSRPYTLARMC